MSRVRGRTERSEACPGRGPARITLRVLRRKKKRRSNRQPRAAARGRPRLCAPPPRRAVRGEEHGPAPGARQHTARPVKDRSTYLGSAATRRGVWGHVASTLHASPRLRLVRHTQGLRLRSASTAVRLTRPHARAGGQTAVAVLLGRAARPSLDAGALRQYIAKPGKERGKATEGQRQERRSRLPPGAKQLTEPPHEGEGGWQESAARAERSGAGAFRVCPLGGSEVRQGAASVRARCRADGGPDMAWQPSCARGQSSGAGVSAAALTGPRAAAQTGIPW